jgi:hypothetical protein
METKLVLAVIAVQRVYAHGCESIRIIAEAKHDEHFTDSLVNYHSQKCK